MTTNRWRSVPLPRASTALALLGALVWSSCGAGGQQRGYEYMPDMVRSVPFDAFAPNPVTRDGRTLQRPVAGTIARGFLPLHYGPTPEDALRAGRELTNPEPVDAAGLAQGQALYETFCAVCHGLHGQGDGPLVPRIPNPPAYSSQRVREMAAGQLFYVATFGSGRMPSYASQVSRAERWKIVAYVQTLQASGEPRP